MNRILSCAALIALVYGAGCGGSNDQQQAKAPSVEPPEQNSISANTTPAAVPSGPSSDQSPLAAGEPPAATTAGSSPGANSDMFPGGAIGGGLPSAEVSLTDDQILQALHTANAGEIEQAKIARQKSKNTQVKHFAGMMIKDHTDADRKGQDVARKAQLSPTPSSVSTRLETDASQLTNSLTSQTGADFDRAYIDAQVVEHQAVLDTIDTDLIPNAKSPEVKKLLASVRSKVESHLNEAKKIQTKFGS